ncbi:MAG: tetratricopeptide repeat protein [Deltaproteobacteria bacterium]|nr:tetratricopeptide repeat protein [Deltaproteobacteria bacterium]
MSISQLLDLAVRHHQEGQLPKAEALYRRVLSAAPDNFTALNNLGNLLNKQAKYDEAQIPCRQATLVNDASGEAHYNLANSMFGLRRYGEAIAGYRRAIAANPGYGPACNNLGNALNEQGEFQEAISSYRQAVALAPDLAEAHYNLGNALVNLPGGFPEAIRQYKKAILAKPGYLEPRTCLAIFSWIHGDWPALAGDIQKLAHANIHDRFAGPFYLFLSRLLAYRELHPEEYAAGRDLPVLPLLGDSHCLSPAHAVIHYKENRYRAEPRIIMGCKAWHLANETGNKFKYWFEQQVASLAEGVAVVVMFGEIDCRIDEGIIHHFKKTGNGLESSIARLVTNYVAYVARVLTSRNISPVFHGVPAPFADKGKPAAHDLKLLSRIISLFNQALARETAARKFFFSDVYALTNDQNGFSSGKYYIDKRHLLPPVLGHLLNNDQSVTSRRQSLDG